MSLIPAHSADLADRARHGGPEIAISTLWQGMDVLFANNLAMVAGLFYPAVK
ncbi:hypothetical protein NKH36_02810 [Mesorhizobium sp. M1312]|uniref:hypothetical protein n=1 Tax=unclassified Mesorhizobium TaxID=325217 RepID=UPI00333847DA